MQIIKDIITGSIAWELNIEPGSRLLRVNGREIEDVFDYEFLMTQDYVELEIENLSGEIDIYPVEKDEDEEMGLVFENSLMDSYRRCSNQCIFCFIDQMPAGMRETLYFKDDDSRLSFLQGNYITMTNMKEKDIDRIIRYRMQPVNISVHTTNPKLRCDMLHNRFAGDVLRYLDKLYEAGILMNGQIVLCKGINDGDELRRTIEELGRYAPVMESVSVVPVGLTKYREGLYPLKPIGRKDAASVIELVEEYQKEFFRDYGIHFIHASDEFYLKARTAVPEEERYDGYMQLENGVGMLRLLMEEFKAAVDRKCDSRGICPEKTMRGKPEARKRTRRTIVTGKLAYDTVASLVRDGLLRIGNSHPEISGCLPDIQVIPIRNDFFGEQITVSGLVCGRDIIKQLKDRDLGSEILLPVNMMRAGEKYFLDDVTVEELEKELGIEAVIVPPDGASLLKAIFGEELKAGGRQIYEQADSGDSRTS